MAENISTKKDKTRKKTRRKLTIGVPYFLLLLVLVYVFFDWYNSNPYDAAQKFSQFEAPEQDWTMVQNVENAFANSNSPSHGTLLYSGRDALSARLAIIEQAEHTLDLQYFLIKPDYAGAIFADALIRASERGVRVRFLIDDVFTSTSNEQMEFLASYPNIELRYFNPLSRKVWKYANYILDPYKSNRRMHNKSITADGIAAVVGGRNIADEYYGISGDEIFADLDVFLAGDIVSDVGQQFDIYWNDELSINANLLLGEMDEEERNQYYEDIKARMGEAYRDVYSDAVNVDYIKELAQGQHPVYEIDGFAVFDQPAKLRQSAKGSQHYPVFRVIEELVDNAETEVFMTSPYFVPEDWGSEMLQDAARRGLKVQVVTNSLQATNHSYVHGGYYYRREELLEAGVELYEVRSDANEVLKIPNAAGEYPHLTMHTKLFIFDKRFVFIGSPNFDPRSMYWNTETGVLIDDPALASQLQNDYEKGKGEYAYQLRLNADGDVEWVFNEFDPMDSTTKEPASFFRRFVAFWAHILPFESQY